jgi:hypothetical protein
VAKRAHGYDSEFFNSGDPLMADSGGYSQQDPEDSASGYRSRQFQIERSIARIRTIMPVRVMAVAAGAGAIAAPGTVNVLPLVKIIDGAGRVSSHETVFNVPVWRVQCAWGSLIVDPVVDDIGIVLVADRDISSVVSSKGEESQPGSRRKHSLSDSIYLGGMFGPDTPPQYLRFTQHGIEMKSGTDGILLNGLKINKDGQVEGALPVTGGLELGGSITALNGSEYAQDISTTGRLVASDVFTPTTAGGPPQVSLRGHIHSANNTPPTPGH